MTANLIDLFFSFSGRISRWTWAFGLVALLTTTGAGLAFFNNDSFDESTNAVTAAPTMAAYLWSLLSIFAATALCVKRLEDMNRSRWMGYSAGLAGFALVSGWGAGLFLHPLDAKLDTLLFWSLILATSPALITCTRAA